MATPEIKPETILSNRDEAQLYVTDEVVKGMVIAPKLGLATTEEKRVNWFTRDKTSKEQFEDNLIMEPMPTEDGSELLEVSGMELTPNSERVMTYGYMYSVDLDDMLASPESYLMDIQDLCWGISKAIETDVASTLIANAVASTYTPSDGNWDTSTGIDKDVWGYQNDYANRDIRGMLRQAFVNGTNFKELGDFIIDSEGIKNFMQADGVINYMDTAFNKAAVGVSEGTILGFDDLLPPGFVKYRSIKGAYKPITTKPGTEQYLPVINMKIEDTEERRMEPVRTFKFAASWRTAITRPTSILYDTGI